MPNDESPQGFVRTKLPWIAAAGALVLFLITLNQWVNLRSLPVAARITGWDWTIPVQHPLLYLLTFPFRFLPAGIQPFALNAFTALCAALTIGLLARSVALLPHDRTHEQRTRERSEFSLLSIKFAWLPPVLAVLVCGLQLTFWENATAITGEALDLLLFAYVIRCLLEYRISQNESWLSKFAIVYGLGVTNNWALIGFFPAFLAALIWIKGLRFFDPGFMLRMVLLGVAGLLLYLLLPAVWMVKGGEDVSFWQVLKSNLVSQKLFLADMKVLRNRALLLSLTSVLPVVLMGIRWPSSFGDTSAAGANLTNLAFRVIHLFFLGACIWVAFDPKYSPRHLGFGISFLTFYYLGALAIGYYSGYALLVFSSAPSRKGWKRDDALGKLLNPVVRAAMIALVVAVPAALIYKNYPSLKSSDGAMLREYVDRTTKLLPAAPAYLLSEDPFQLALVRAGLDGAGRKGEYVIVNTRSLETPAYHEELRKRHGERWPAIFDPADVPARVDPVDIQQLVRRLATTNSVVYLHPSFGYFFEYLYPEPNGQIYALRPFETNQVTPPALPPEVLQGNAEFWSGASAHVEKVRSLTHKGSPDADFLAMHYARALNTWGVFLQRSGKLEEAGLVFTQAHDLNTNNLPARINRDFNKAVTAGQNYEFDVAAADELLGTYASWDEMLAGNGPVDQPYLCFMLGSSFVRQSQFRQAAFQFSRTIHFQPTNFLARVALAKSLVFGGWADKGVAEIARLEAEMPDLPSPVRAEIAGVRAAALYSQKEFAKAEEMLKQAQQALPDETALSDSLVELYRASGRYNDALAQLNRQIERSPTNLLVQLQKAELLLGREDFTNAHATLDGVLAVSPNNTAALLFHAFAYIQQKKFEEALVRIDKVLQGDPDHVQALVYKGIVHMEQKAPEKAREAFDHALNKDPGNVTVLRNRAILNLRTERWEEAREDYEALRKVAPKAHAVLYGLGEVAYHTKDHQSAQRYYQAYLKNAPSSGSPELEEERKKVQARLEEITGGKK